jgi:hypothetical protein
MRSDALGVGLLALALFDLLVKAQRADHGRYGYPWGPTRPPARDYAWASVAWTHSYQADGWLPIGVVRVYNPATVPVIVSVSVRTDAGFFGRFSLLRGGRSPLYVRALRVGRRLQVAKEPLLGIVNGGATGWWELPLGEAGHAVVLKVRVDQAALCSRLFTWKLGPSAIALAPTPTDELVPR